MADLGKAIQHPAFKTAWMAIERCHDAFRREGKAQQLCLTGVSGVGKSKLFKAYRDAHPPYEVPGRTIVPVVYAEVPPKPSIAALYADLLVALGDPAPMQGKIPDQRHRFTLLTKKCCVELILIDEMNHLLDRGRLRTHEASADELKSIVNRAERPVVLAGAPRWRRLLDVNGQLRGRFMREIRLPPFSILSDEALLIWQGILKSFSKRLRVRNPEFIYIQAAESIFYATDGILRNVVNLLDELEQGGEPPELTFPLLEDAFRRALWLDAFGDRNPFSRRWKARRLNKSGEPYMPTELDGDNHQWDQASPPAGKDTGDESDDA